MNACEPTLRHCPLAASSESGLPTTSSVNSVISVHQSPNDHHAGQKSEANEKSKQINGNKQTEITEPSPNSDVSCDSWPTSSKKTPTKSSGGSFKVEESRGKTDIITDNLLLYGFNAADWLDGSFTDEKSGTDTVTPLSCSVATKDNNKCTRPRFKIYEDHGGSASQNGAKQLSKSSSTKVLSDRTNIAHRDSQIWTKNRSQVIKRTPEIFSVCKENDKPQICVPYETSEVDQRASVIDRANSTKNGQKLLSESADHDVNIRMSENYSEVFSNVSDSAVIALSSATVNGVRTQLPPAATAVTASCKISAIVTSSVLVLTSSAVTFHSSAIGSHMPLLNAMTCASSVSSITVCSTVLISDSAKHQTVGSCRSSFSCSAAVPQLCPSSIRTPQNQSSVRSLYSTKFWTPGTMVTPRNQSVPNSTMKPTPPMCSCGCRAKRKFVQSPGQNIGRPFYCCGASTRTSKKGCNFFKWENSCSVTPVVRSSGVTPLSTKQSLSMQTAGRNERFNTPLSYRDARQATSFHILVPPSFK